MELPRFKDLVTEAVDRHGKATADLLTRVGKGDKVDLTAEAAKCVGDLAQTGARFVLFWDNIATLMAASGDDPLTFPGARPCNPGEIRTFQLHVDNVNAATVQSGLRRRGDAGVAIDAKAITVRVQNRIVVIEVDCGGATRGLYEGTLSVTDVAGNQDSHAYNVYIDPGA